MRTLVMEKYGTFKIKMWFYFYDLRCAIMIINNNLTTKTPQGMLVVFC